MQGYLSVNYSDNYYLLSQRFPEVPRLTPAHFEAMALFNDLAKCAQFGPFVGFLYHADIALCETQ